MLWALCELKVWIHQCLDKMYSWVSLPWSVSAVGNFLYIAKYSLWSDITHFICPRWIYDWRQNKPWANLIPSFLFISKSRSWNRAIPATRRAEFQLTFIPNIWGSSKNPECSKTLNVYSLQGSTSQMSKKPNPHHEQNRGCFFHWASPWKV